jgi:hypothetical protein
MVTVPDKTFEILRGRAAALRTTMDRVNRRDLESSDALGLWDDAADWLTAAEKVLARPDAAARLAEILPLPLSGGQLRKLQAAIDRVAAEQAGQLAGSTSREEREYRRAMAAPVITARDRLHATLHVTTRSSVWIAIALGSLVAANLAELVFLRDASPHAIIVVNLLFGVGALVAWWIHHTDLMNHHKHFRWLHLHWGS